MVVRGGGPIGGGIYILQRPLLHTPEAKPIQEQHMGHSLRALSARPALCRPEAARVFLVRVPLIGPRPDDNYTAARLGQAASR